MDRKFLINFSKDKENKFPKKLVTEDSLRYRDLLFKDSTDSQGHIQKGVLDMSDAFIIESDNINVIETVPKKTNQNVQNVKKISANNNQATPNQSQTFGRWRQNNNAGNDTINFLKEGAKSNQNEVENFVKGNKKENLNEKNFVNPVEETMYYNIGNNLNDTMKEYESIGNITEMNMTNNNEYPYEVKNINSNSNPQVINNFDPRQVPYAYVPRGVPITFAPMMPLGMVPNIPNLHTVPNMPVPPTRSKEQVNIENIFLFNDKINFPRDQPLWYISNTWPSLVLTGALSSNQMIDLYKMNIFDGSFSFRPLDIFSFKNVNSSKNEMNKIKIINDVKWVDDLVDSSLLQYTELFHTSKKLLEISSQKKEKPAQSENKIKSRNDSQTVIKPITKLANFDDDTLQLTLLEDKKEIRKFIEDTEVEYVEPKINKNDITNVMDIVKQIDNQDINWEVVDKKKKKQKDYDESFYLVGNKPKKDVKKETNKPTMKIDIITPEELVKNLMPKNLREDIKPNYEAFTNQHTTETKDNKNVRKKGKGKPQELNVKLGFKI